ncbi:Lipid A core - O-antigen ligase and related enzymes [Moraxella lacunata]|uniref:Lipid A core - O-antigen ligase and related enzymes n=1 Tax=Moraxella lacunata TaxID=477 RepID=A0A378QHH9_MORLA|nr:O-antigen ligase family protein [Moraxella lacunata]STZ00357.1 Lipid A core - O-antigen ligase and related enzymes [Moraxella lacunata]
MIDKLKNTPLLAFIIIAITYIYGIISPSHYSMVTNDFNSALVLTTLFGLGVFFGLRNVDVKKIGFSTLTWLAFAIIILIQPMVNRIHYADALIFPFGLFLLALSLSIWTVNIPTQYRDKLTDYLAWVLLLAGVLSTITQFIQLFYPNTFGFIAPISPIKRLYSNLAQPNQASFVNVLSIVCVFYLYYCYHHCKKVMALLALSFFVLVMGITFSLSRVGLILLVVAIFGALFYGWSSHKLRYLICGVSILLSFIAYQSAMWLMRSFSSIYQGSSGVERLLSEGTNLRQILLERAWSAFASNPLFGVGYDNYLPHGLANIENLAWFEPADHAHNIIAQIGAEFGLVGIVAMLGVVFVLLQKLFLFFNSKISPQELFLSSLVLIFLLYSFSEFPLWMPIFFFPFVFIVALLDKGFSLKNIQIQKVLILITFIAISVSFFYSYLYHRYLRDYEIVAYGAVDNQTKIDAYQRFPHIFGFQETKEYMLHTVIDENASDPNKLLEMGERLMNANASMDVTRVQVRLLMKQGRQQEADTLHRRLCIWEYQRVKNCDIAMDEIFKVDEQDSMGYAKRLSDWYESWRMAKEAKK